MNSMSQMRSTVYSLKLRLDPLIGALDHNETRNISKRVIKEKKKRKDRQSLLERQPPLERGYMTPMTQIPHIAEVEYFKEIYKECFDLKEMYAKMEIQPNKQFIECVAMLLDIKSPRDTLSKEIRMLSKQSVDEMDRKKKDTHKTNRKRRCAVLSNRVSKDKKKLCRRDDNEKNKNNKNNKKKKKKEKPYHDEL
eukprot:621465_1